MQNNVELNIRNNKRLCTWQEAITILKMSAANINQAVDIATQLSTQFPNNLLTATFKNTNEYQSFFQLLHQLQQFKLLIDCASAAVDFFKDDAKSYFMLSMAYRQLRDEEASLAALISATELIPHQIQWRQMLGVFYKERGEKEQALSCFNACIDQDPTFIEAYWQRSSFKPILPDVALNSLANMVDIYAENDSSSSNNKIYAAYCLFRHYDELNQPHLAFEYLTKGANLKRKQLSFNIHKEVIEHQLIAENFDENLLKKHASLSHDNNQGCIFVCGLPRSGTTLAEHILAAHSEITAGDELFSLAQATQQVTSKKKGLKPFPTWAQQLTSNEWQQIGSNYLELTKSLRKTPFLTDKMPLNYKAIGLINLALPNAKIIYCLRNPMDVLFGCFKQLLGQGNAYTYHLDEMAQMIIAHHKLMQHWQFLFPDKIFTLSYKDLVTEQEKTTINLINFIGLPMENACLDFYQSKRTVHTISNLQIREPISSKNLASWKKYESFLYPYYQEFLAQNILCD